MDIQSPSLATTAPAGLLRLGWECYCLQRPSQRPFFLVVARQQRARRSFKPRAYLRIEMVLSRGRGSHRTERASSIVPGLMASQLSCSSPMWRVPHLGLLEFHQRHSNPSHVQERSPYCSISNSIGAMGGEVLWKSCRQKEASQKS